MKTGYPSRHSCPSSLLSEPAWPFHALSMRFLIAYALSQCHIIQNRKLSVEVRGQFFVFRDDESEENFTESEKHA